MPQRVTFLKACENKTSLSVKKHRDQSAAEFYFKLAGFLIFGLMGAAQLYRYAFKILPSIHFSNYKPSDTLLMLGVFSVALVQNGYYVYKYVALPCLNYNNNHNKEIQVEKIQDRIKALTGVNDAATAQLKLKKD